METRIKIAMKKMSTAMSTIFGNHGLLGLDVSVDIELISAKGGSTWLWAMRKTGTTLIELTSNNFEDLLLVCERESNLAFFIIKDYSLKRVTRHEATAIVYTKL